MKKEIFCECVTWCRSDSKVFTEHHKNCPKYDPEGDARNIIEALIKGIECWARDEDGVHYECYEAYKNAMCFLLRPPKVQE